MLGITRPSSIRYTAGFPSPRSFRISSTVIRDGPVSIRPPPFCYPGPAMEPAPWIDRQMNQEELEQLRARLLRMSDSELRKNYEAALHMCQLDRGGPPRATFVQQLVQ